MSKEPLTEEQKAWLKAELDDTQKRLRDYLDFRDKNPGFTLCNGRPVPACPCPSCGCLLVNGRCFRGDDCCHVRQTCRCRQ